MSTASFFLKLNHTRTCRCSIHTSRTTTFSSFKQFSIAVCRIGSLRLWMRFGYDNGLLDFVLWFRLRLCQRKTNFWSGSYGWCRRWPQACDSLHWINWFPLVRQIVLFGAQYVIRWLVYAGTARSLSLRQRSMLVSNNHPFGRLLAARFTVWPSLFSSLLTVRPPMMQASAASFTRWSVVWAPNAVLDSGRLQAGSQTFSVVS